jgi:hypothetical protein
MQINTEHFQIIFPHEITEYAHDVAARIESIYTMETEAYHPVRQSRWPIILVTSSMEANGFVSMPPRKSIWYGTPVAEDLPPMAWFDLLSLHETRHMIQYDALNRRLNRLFYFLGGQSGLTVGIYWGIPEWFLEGDAVAAETLYSDSGRGRDPAFHQQLKEIVLNEEFSYAKMVNRSYKDYVPNEYELGYFLTSYLRNSYGEDSWNLVLDSVSALPFPAFGLYVGAKSVSGLSLADLYKEMAADLKDQWTRRDQAVELITNEKITAPGRTYTLWEPLSFETDRILARRTALNRTASLVEITPEGERDLIRVPSSSDITVHGDKAVWTYENHSALNDGESWSDLVLVDLKKGSREYLTRKQRYLTPSFSPDGRFLAVVEWAEELKSHILVLDAEVGLVLERYTLPDQLFAAYPCWSEEGEQVFFTVQGKNGRAIACLDRKTRVITILTEFSSETVKRLHYSDRTLFYSSNYSGYENVMMLKLETGELFQISSRLNGMRNPLTGRFRGEDVILYSEYTSLKGEQLALQKNIPSLRIPGKSIEKTPFLYYPLQDNPALLSFNEKGISTESEDSGNWEIEEYKLSSDWGRIHSWGLGTDPESDTALSLYLMAEDIFGTLDWNLGGSVDVNETSDGEISAGAFLNLNWTRRFPDISWQNSYWQRDVDSLTSHDLSSDLRFSLPLNLDGDLWYHRLTPYAGAGVETFIPVETGQAEGLTSPLHYGLLWYSALPGSSRSLNPLWGVSLRTYYTHTPLQEDDLSLFSTSLGFYLPGGFRNTGFYLQGSYEHQTGYRQSRVIFSRGYDAVKEDNLYQYSGSYVFPIAYPDLALGSWAFIKRVRGKLFYDNTGLYEAPGSAVENFSSVGGVLKFDFIPLNVRHFPLNLGVRFSWLIEEKEPVVQVVFMTLDL